MMKEIFKRLYLLLPILLFLSMSCGSNNPAAPSGSVMTINPSEFEIKVGEGIPLHTRSMYFTITVYEDTAKTKTMSDIEVAVDFTFAMPNDIYFIQLYHDGERVQSPITARTDKYGTYVIRVDYQSGGGLTYEGFISARSASVYVSADFVVDTE